MSKEKKRKTTHNAKTKKDFAKEEVKIFIDDKTSIYGLIIGLIRGAELKIVEMASWNEQPLFLILKVKKGLGIEVVKQVDTFGIRAEVLE